MASAIIPKIGSELIAPFTKSVTASAPVMLLGVSSAMLFKAYVDNQLLKQAGAVIFSAAALTLGVFAKSQNRAAALGLAGVYLTATAVAHAILFVGSRLNKVPGRPLVNADLPDCLLQAATETGYAERGYGDLTPGNLDKHMRQLHRDLTGLCGDLTQKFRELAMRLVNSNGTQISDDIAIQDLVSHVVGLLTTYGENLSAATNVTLSAQNQQLASLLTIDLTGKDYSGQDARAQNKLLFAELEKRLKSSPSHTSDV